MKLCRDNGAYLFSDEMYRLLEVDPDSRLPSAVDAYEKAITLSGTAFQRVRPVTRFAGALPIDTRRRSLQWAKSGSCPGLAGLSKAWGLPGLRLGWLATHDAAVLQQVLELKDYTTM